MTASEVVRVLTRFLSVFGFPQVVQTDQGCNVMSKVFAQVLKLLDMKVNPAHTIWRVKANGFSPAFEIYTLYVLFGVRERLGCGGILQMFVLRYVVQESFGFGPSAQVFAHTLFMVISNC